MIIKSSQQSANEETFHLCEKYGFTQEDHNYHYRFEYSFCKDFSIFQDCKK